MIKGYLSNRGKFPGEWGSQGFENMIQAGGQLASLIRLTHTDLIGVVRELIGEVGRLRTENEKLSGALTKLKVEHQAVKLIFDSWGRVAARKLLILLVWGTDFSKV